jgi:hypothetical protein
VKAFDIILHKGKTGEVYNIGTEFEITNLEVARQLIAHFNLSDRENEFLVFVEDRKFNDKRYAIDSAKLRQLGWKPETPWKQGLQQTSMMIFICNPFIHSFIHSFICFDIFNFYFNIFLTVDWVITHEHHWSEARIMAAIEPHPNRSNFS